MSKSEARPCAELQQFLLDVTARGGEERDGDPILGAQMAGKMVVAVPSGQSSTLLAGRGG